MAGWRGTGVCPWRLGAVSHPAGVAADRSTLLIAGPSTAMGLPRSVTVIS